MDSHGETAGAGQHTGAIVVGGGRGAVLEGTVFDPRDGANASSLATVGSPTLPFVPRGDVRVRAGTLEDLPFIDALQKANSRAVGFLPTMALEGKIRLREVLIAEVGDSPRSHGDTENVGIDFIQTPLSVSPCLRGEKVGYLIASDRYFKRDEVGYVTQMNVSPNYRRSLVAATLLQAQFDRSAYGCKLYSCWCAQDLKANEFWEAMGFTAIAFRTGSRTKGKGGSPRIHLFWQKRVRADDRSTAFWYPAQTGGGALREDRLVFPIPPGTGWRDVLPIVLPGEGQGATGEGRGNALATEAVAPAKGKLTREERMRAMAIAPRRARGALSFGEAAPPTELELKLVDADARAEAREAIRTRMRLHPPKLPTRPVGHVGVIWYIPDYNDYQPNEVEIDQEIVDSLSTERKRREAKRAQTLAKKAAAVLDPTVIAFAREMRDRWLESSGAIVALPAKHEVARRIEATEMPKLGLAA